MLPSGSRRAFFDQLPEFPLGAKLLARGQRDMGAGAQGLEGIGIFTAQRILDEKGTRGFDLATEPQSRLEGLTKQYGVRIIISNAVKQDLGKDFFLRHLDNVKVKGKSIAVSK